MMGAIGGAADPGRQGYSTTPREVLEALAAGFEDARRRVEPAVLHLACGRVRVRLRVAGAALAAVVLEPFRHLATAPPADARLLTTDLWSAEETGVVPHLPAGLGRPAGAWGMRVTGAG